MLFGYARVSPQEQDTAAQVTALKAAKCEQIFGNGRWDRPELSPFYSTGCTGDVLVVWELDRLSRSLRDVLTIMERLREHQARFRSLTEPIDTTNPAECMTMQMVGAFAEFERAMLREHTKIGLDAARQEGRVGGRRPKPASQQHKQIVTMVSRVGSAYMISTPPSAAERDVQSDALCVRVINGPGKR